MGLARFCRPECELALIASKRPNISKRMSDSWTLRGSVVVQANRAIIRFPSLLGKSLLGGFPAGSFERLRRQRDHDGERSLRAFRALRDTQGRAPLLCGD